MAKKKAPTKRDKLASRAVRFMRSSSKARRNIADATVVRHIRPLRRDLNAAVKRITGLEDQLGNVINATALRCSALESRCTNLEHRMGDAPGEPEGPQ